MTRTVLALDPPTVARVVSGLEAVQAHGPLPLDAAWACVAVEADDDGRGMDLAIVWARVLGAGRARA